MLVVYGVMAGVQGEHTSGQLGVVVVVVVVGSEELLRVYPMGQGGQVGVAHGGEVEVIVLLPLLQLVPFRAARLA